MKVSGFTFIRNGESLGYPFIESIRSVLPICDEFVIAVAEGNDNTLQQVQNIGDPKIRIVETVWNESMQQVGYVYGQQKMIAQFCCNGDWAFYLEGDEVVHEDDLDNIVASMKENLNKPEVEALAFDYYHFYGTPSYYLNSPGWYRREVRIIRNTIRTIAPDGLYFVVLDKKKRGKKGRYPIAALANAKIYHYGHVRNEQKMQAKIRSVRKYWADESSDFERYGNIDAEIITSFEGSHPKVVQPWLKDNCLSELKLNPDYQLSKRERKHRLMMKFERWFGLELSKKHFYLYKK